MTTKATSLTTAARGAAAVDAGTDALPRSIASAQLLARFGQERGLSLTQCLATTGITAAVLDDPKAEIGAAQELRLIGNLVEHLDGDSGIGIDVGLRYHLGIYGVWGFALATSPNAKALAETAIRFLDLSFAFVRFSLESRDGNAVLRMDASGLDERLRQFVLERDFAAMVNCLKEVMPGVQPFQAIQFSGPRPPSAQRLKELCGIPPTFDNPVDQVLMVPGLLEQPLPRGDAQVFRACEDYCRRLVERLNSRVGTAARVRDIMLRAPHCMPDIDAVAAELHVSGRSLRRKLSVEGTSFRALGDEVRRALAEDLLRTTRLKLEEVAERLGYADAVSFLHAFGRWTGMSPSAYRNKHWGPYPR